MRIWVVLACLLWSGIAQADGLFSMNSREDGRKWEAVGRLELAGDAFCTGALIAPHLVLTAAHCLFDSASGAAIPVEDLQFLAGWRNGRAATYRRIKRAAVHPDYQYSGPADAARVRNDVALLELQLPVRSSSIVPFATDAHPATGARVGVVSYAHNRSEAPSLQEVCNVINYQDGMLVLSCAVDFGASGSPVFSFDDTGTPRIVSVVSAKAEANGKPVSLGTSLQIPLEILKATLASAENPGVGTEPMTAGIRRETGAKFVKP